jgi:predicted O-methyltransferase YrrM
MLSRHLQLTPALHDYMLDVSLREHPVLTRLREETAKLPLCIMQISPEQAQFMQCLIRLMGAKNVLEIGTFTGYSALALALALPEDGHLITCDYSREWTDIARPFWQEAGLDKKIELRLGPALATLDQLLQDGLAQSFDLSMPTKPIMCIIMNVPCNWSLPKALSLSTMYFGGAPLLTRT